MRYTDDEMIDGLQAELAAKDAKIAELEAELARLRNMPSFLTQSTFLNPPKDIKRD